MMSKPFFLAPLSSNRSTDVTSATALPAARELTPATSALRTCTSVWLQVSTKGNAGAESMSCADKNSRASFSDGQGRTTRRSGAAWASTARLWPAYSFTVWCWSIAWAGCKAVVAVHCEAMLRHQPPPCPNGRWFGRIEPDMKHHQIQVLCNKCCWSYWCGCGLTHQPVP